VTSVGSGPSSSRRSVEGEVSVVLLAVGEVVILEISCANRREHTRRGAGLPLNLCASVPLTNAVRSASNLGRPALPANESCAEEGEDDIRLVGRHPRLRRAETGRPEAQRELSPLKPRLAEGEFGGFGKRR